MVAGIELEPEQFTDRTSEDLRGARLQPIDAWIFEINVIADLCIGHRPAHARGPGARVPARAGAPVRRDRNSPPNFKP